ncbi:MAG: hypothetical protein JWL87_160 [Candidatus Adlerbacteria bacterium]|nr:hypothetical protein [Candidatus Adlerbacteria bacterium]
MTNIFSIKESVVFGWHKVKAHSGLVFGVVVTMILFQFFSSAIQSALEDSGPAFFLASVVFSVVSIVLGAGMTVIFLRLARGDHAHYRDLVPKLGLVWKYFCSGLLAGLISFLPLLVGGLLALGILVATGSVNFSEGPWQGSVVAVVAAALIGVVALVGAFYLSLRYSMSRLAVIDGAGIIESIDKSSKLTHGVKGQLVLFILALIGLNLLGLLALVVGLLVTIPITAFAFAHVYLKLKSHHGHH